MQQSNTAGVPGCLGRVSEKRATAFAGRAAAVIGRAAAVSSVALLLSACSGEVPGLDDGALAAPSVTHPNGPLGPPAPSASESTVAPVPGSVAGSAGILDGDRSGGSSASSSDDTGTTPTWSAQPSLTDTTSTGPFGDMSGVSEMSGVSDTSSAEPSALADPSTGSTSTDETSSDETSTSVETSTGVLTSTSDEDTLTGETVVSEFNIELRFVAQVSDLVNEAFDGAVQRWERVIVGDLPDIPSADVPCGTEHRLQGPVDDLVIFVEVKPIDGPQGILGAAAPCAVRRADGLPLAGLMQFDEVDLEDFARRGRLEEIVLHEMGHVLGIGSLWPNRGLLRDRSPGNNENVDTWFAGEAAIEAFDQVGGDQYQGAKVPVENVGGEGTANGHWRDAVLGTELMTSFMSGQLGQLSIVSIASLRDLGYQVDMSQADDYSWPAPLRLLSLTDEDFEPIAYGDDIIDIDLHWVD